MVAPIDLAPLRSSVSCLSVIMRAYRQFNFQCHTMPIIHSRSVFNVYVRFIFLSFCVIDIHEKKNPLFWLMERYRMCCCCQLDGRRFGVYQACISSEMIVRWLVVGIVSYSRSHVHERHTIRTFRLTNWAVCGKLYTLYSRDGHLDN